MESRRRAQASATTRPDGEGALKLVLKDGLSPAERQRQTAEYLAEMVLELRNLARSAQLYTVMVPLEYAYYESFSVANRVEIPEAEIERIKALSKASQEFEAAPNGGAAL